MSSGVERDEAECVPRPMPPERLDIALGPLQEQYGDLDVTSRDYFEWMFRENPDGDGVAWYGDTGDPDRPSAGHFMLAPRRFEVNGTVVMGALGANVVVRHEYRRRGILVAVATRVLEEARQRGILFSFGFPARAANTAFTGRIGYRPIGPVPFLVAPLDSRGIDLPSAHWAVRALARAGAPFAVAASRLLRSLGGEPRAVVDEVGASWTGFDALWERLRGKRAVMGIRDNAFMAWRYGACPSREYRVYVARIDGEPRGLIVTRIATVLGLHAGLVVDLLVEQGPAGDDAARALARAAVSEFRNAGTALASSLMPAATAEYGALRRAGFFRCPRFLEPQPFFVILNRHDPERAPSVPDRIEEWFATQGDYDAV